ncbi:glycerol dehydratase reactivase beta/small subunit family protein [Tessaracoccus sp. OH4464_COT-324]|uniref:glycerol dehydratase reactivase beta/small subunit family protein n=1 Tax=Tessaracoccus sp. OH4464_COT-324 TaxID=2491059 RepID=UPI001F19A022|nr:glycerol dehydratase reactivase beta/small subunit family protein [Tessaracoccus sp. OH4464_COT-324]
MMRIPPAESPTIELFAATGLDERQLSAVLLGVEEEGVPCVVSHREELNPLVLAKSAATSSRLGVGIGMSLDYAVVTLDKLPEARPYIVVQSTSAEAARLLGSNAARIVKRIPLRGFTERNQ